MFKKEIKYGYSTETIGDNTAQIVKPLNLTKIRLTPTNSKFVFYGTRHDILKWMSSHSKLLVEYDPLDQSNNNNNDGLVFSPPPSPPPSACPVISETLASSPTSLNFPSISTVDPTSKNQHDITFDLFPAPIKTSALLSDDLVFYRPLNLALNYIPWVEVMLEIRPTDQYNDLKLSPIHRVILPSGLSLSKISKALEKSWKNLIPDLTGHGSRCFIRDDILSHSKKKSKSNSPVLTPTNSDNEGGESEEGEQSYNKETHQQKFIDWFPKARQKQSDDIIPPGILTPYIIDDVLKDLGEKREESVKEQVLSDKREEAESNKESPKADLPRYENTYKDVLLEEGI